MLEVVLSAGLDGLVDGGEIFVAATTAARASPSLLGNGVSRIGMQGIDTALRGTTNLFWATGTLAQRSRCSLPIGDESSTVLIVH